MFACCRSAELSSTTSHRVCGGGHFPLLALQLAHQNELRKERWRTKKNAHFLRPFEDKRPAEVWLFGGPEGPGDQWKRGTRKREEGKKEVGALPCLHCQQ